MPIFRYFVFVGGALLALLFAADYVLPSQPVERAIVTASNDQPLIRIRSDRHLPERVVLDTSQPTIAAPAVKTAAVVAPQPPVQEAASPELAEMSAKARVRETFAQFTPAPKDATRKADAKPQAQAQPPQAAAQPKRKVARSHPAPQQGRPMMMVAQRPQFGFFW
ncbi:hypothetical protein ABIF65_002395 [Bradyrhizobium japonicum]|jgi:hypothetical protein|uniref:hypothetical protein n=1 Tax=Bradyrhizobium TaxID=374 RepID=UPI00041EE313|nr:MULTISPECIES: hypothetical protein [Bradyrhizobium]MBR0879548.1 hypothetical protein [Bradyrhizobium liaoningense]MBR0944679.1 hypothetical protein [Bradyrhizobium liaoningense]MBR0998718.1 hypothetical protein [Bradyrhizobium liaoningense]MBR1030592.1 hypothetical protein [Bradyrhizobium liaoningense]MBR1067514.1 hypothetical protein [Bradyrhizobium liaoningense]